jgi:hypothetical protein
VFKLDAGIKESGLPFRIRERRKVTLQLGDPASTRTQLPVTSMAQKISINRGSAERSKGRAAGFGLASLPNIVVGFGRPRRSDSHAAQASANRHGADSVRPATVHRLV